MSFVMATRVGCSSSECCYARRIHQGLPECCGGHMDMLRATRVSMWPPGYSEDHRSVVVATWVT